MAGTDRTRQETPQHGPAIILVAPQLGENIGTAARAMFNFGLTDLRLVAPRDGWPNDWAVKAATGALDHINVRLYDTTAQAIADLNYVTAATARARDMVKPVLTPEMAAATIREKAGQGECSGILFGAERAGLNNDDVALADAILMVPVNPGFASLNLAQAVLLTSYEWFKLGAWTLGDHARDDGGLSRPGTPMANTRAATREELIGFFEHLEGALDQSRFLRPLEKRPAMIRNIRNMFHRAQLTEQDVRTLRGVVASFSDWRPLPEKDKSRPHDRSEDHRSEDS